MPLYFAYGANMDVEAMRQRCPSSKALGPARLARHRFFIMKEGYASVMRDPRAHVHGVLWDLALSDVPALDRFEAIDRGLYAKLTQPVQQAGKSVRALVYVGASREAGRARPGYLESVLVSAEHWALPEDYRREMRKLLSEPPRSVAAPANAERATDAWVWEP